MNDRREWYANEAQKLRRIMFLYNDEAVKNRTAVHADYYVQQNELHKVIRNYRAYCRRNGLDYGYMDI